jgi:hypothetical protein
MSKPSKRKARGSIEVPKRGRRRGGPKPEGYVFGRPKGSVNRRTLELREQIEQLVAQGKGEPPAVILFKIANNRKAGLAVRARAAGDLMPYLHPKLSTMDINLDAQIGGGVRVVVRAAEPVAKEGV